jgi:hypothetical protein
MCHLFAGAAGGLVAALNIKHPTPDKAKPGDEMAFLPPAGNERVDHAFENFGTGVAAGLSMGSFCQVRTVNSGTRSWKLIGPVSSVLGVGS